ncbi:hypothetical protein E4U92_00630, partial [Streptomyces galbus]
MHVTRAGSRLLRQSDPCYRWDAYRCGRQTPTGEGGFGMKFDMGAQTLSTLMRDSRGSSDDLGSLI